MLEHDYSVIEVYFIIIYYNKSSVDFFPKQSKQSEM